MDDTSESRAKGDPLAIALFSEILMADQLVRARLAKALPKGMELSHFSVLNHLSHTNAERTPARLARIFHVTRGAMTNTISRLEWAGYVHVRPDWDDARRKFVSVSDAGRRARDEALAAIAPILDEAVRAAGTERVRGVLPVLREIRRQFEEPATGDEEKS